MICEGCGAKGWFKTCKWRTGASGRRLVLCDSCYSPLAECLWIVAGYTNVASKCNGCGRYVHPTEIDPSTAIVGGHGKRDVVSTGLCLSCSKR